MTCADWIEWNVTSQNLKYEYRIASYPSDRYVNVYSTVSCDIIVRNYM